MNNQKVLIVDDSLVNREFLATALTKDYDVYHAESGLEAVSIIKSGLSPDLILLDIIMPVMNGFDTFKEIRKHKEDVPIIFISGRTDINDELTGLSYGAVDYIFKPFNPVLVKARIDNHLELKLHRDKLEEQIQRRTYEKTKIMSVLIDGLANLAEYRDPDIAGHINRTKLYVKMLSYEMAKQNKFKSELTSSFLESLIFSSPLHDLGKIAVPDRILLKKGRHSEEEFDKMKQHTVNGEKAIKNMALQLSDLNILNVACDIALSHHENWDGTGYPNALKGTAIPIAGRIMAIVDVYDALVSKRVYKPPFTHSDSVKEIIRLSGKKFDPEIVECFVNIEEEIRIRAIRYADFEEEIEALSFPYKPDSEEFFLDVDTETYVKRSSRSKIIEKTI